MDPSELIQECLLDTSGDKFITNYDIKLHIESPFTTYCEAFIPESERDPESIYLNLLSRKEKEVELQYLTESIPEYLHNDRGFTFQGFHDLIQNMFLCVDFLCFFPLYYLPLNFAGYPDFLRKNESSPSIFGDFHYEIIEIKLAENLEDKHILPIMFFNKILGEIQDFLPETVFIIDRKGNLNSYNYSDYSNKLDTVLNEIRHIRAKKLNPPAIYDCSPFPWSTYIKKIALLNDDVSCLPGIGPSIRQKLIENNINTLTELANSSKEDLESISGIGEKTSVLFLNQAQSFVQKKNIFLKPIKFDASPIEIFIDFEGVDPVLSMVDESSFVFLFGVIIRDTQTFQEEFKPFLIRDPLNESEMKEITESFFDFLLEFDSPIYHWHSYEHTLIKQQGEKFNLLDKVERILPRLRDLYSLVKSSWIFPIPSLSVKTVAKYLGFSWRIQEFDGRIAIAKYIQYFLSLDKPEINLDEITQYNEDDIKAMIYIKIWIENNSIK